MDTAQEYQRILAEIDRAELVTVLHDAVNGHASNDEERREVLEFLHRKRFINLELSRPRLRETGKPIIEIVGASLTASGGQLLDWLEPHERESV